MASRSQDYSHTTDQDPSLVHIKLIGAGGYGEIRNMADNQAFARKLLHEPLKRNSQEAISNEARALSKLGDGSHQNLIKLLSYGRLQHSSYSYFDMELCDFTLADYINSVEAIAVGLNPYRSLTPPAKVIQCCEIMQQIAYGVSFVHGLGEVHRDLKPSNNSNWKLADFGLTSQVTSSRSQVTARARGSQGYASPEIVRLNKYSKASDIWSMGCILYELAAGVKPFINDAAVTLFWIGHNPRFNASLDHTKYDINTKHQISKSVLKMLDIDPKVRPNASELSLAFAGCLGIDDASSHLLQNGYLGSEGRAEQVELATTSPIRALNSVSEEKSTAIEDVLDTQSLIQPSASEGTMNGAQLLPPESETRSLGDYDDATINSSEFEPQITITTTLQRPRFWNWSGRSRKALPRASTPEPGVSEPSQSRIRRLSGRLFGLSINK